MATATHRPPIDIGKFRKIRLPLKPEPNGYFSVYYCDADKGYVTRRETTKTKVWPEAQAYYDQFCADAWAAIAAQGPVAPPRPTIDRLCERWIEHAHRAGKHPANGYVLVTVREVFGQRYIEDLIADPQLLGNYRTGRRPGPRGPVSDWTVARELGALRTVARWGVDQKLIDCDLVELTRVFKRAIPPPGAPRDKFLDWDQRRWFWDQAIAWGHQAHVGANQPAMNQRQRYARHVTVFTALALATAARRGAILDLTWDRVSLERNLIAYRVPGKTYKSKQRPDPLPISRELRPVLEEAYALARKDPSGKATGKVVDVTDIEEAFRTFARTIGVPWVTPHVLRHTWASLAAMAGKSMNDISKVMADSVVTIEKHYSHLSPGHLEDVVNIAPPVRPALKVVA